MQVSFAELIAAGAVTDSSEAAALALAAVDALGSRADLRGIMPALDEIVLDPEGVCSCRLRGSAEAIPATGVPAAGHGPLSDVARLAGLTRELMGLDPAADRSRTKVPGPLLLLLARALGQIDLPPPPYATLREALAAHAAPSLASLGAICRRVAPMEPMSTAPPHNERRRQAADPWLLRREIRGLERRLYDTLARRSSPATIRVSGAAAALGGAVLGLAIAAMLSWTGLLRLPEARPPTTPTTAATTAAPRDADGGRRTTAPAGETRHTTPRSRGRASTLSPIAMLDSPSSPGASAYSPSFSGDGRRVMFHVGRQPAALMRGSLGPRGELLRVTPILRDDAANYHVVESADGQSIAFDSDRLGTRGVYVAAADGSDPVRVTDGAYAALPSWSPDGHRLAFIKADAARPQVWNVWVADLAAGTTTQLTHLRVGQAWRPSWFPDGRRLAYSVEDRLVIADVASGERQVFASPVRGRLLRTPAVAPDGRRVVFQVYRDGVWLLDLRTGGMLRILSDPTAEEFAWQPDGRTVAYHARANGRWTLWQLPMPAGADRIG